MKKLIVAILMVFLNAPQILAVNNLQETVKQTFTFKNNSCKDIKQTDIPTIFIPWILASWYSEYWYENTRVKRWIPDPITHSYDTLFYAFKQNGYHIRDVFYANEFKTYIEGNPKQSLYLFWYDWKKDNKITAKLLRDLVMDIRIKYEKENWCDIKTVNIVAHSMWWLVARAMLEDMCASEKDIDNYYKNTKKWQIKNIKSDFCYNFTRVNKLITISTPQRWSPNSFPLWTKWDIHNTTELVQSLVLKNQLWVFKNDDLYKIIHWYDTKIPNGIVTIWQLLPDIQKSNKYNNELSYLYKNNKKLDRKNHPRNNFLEELNLDTNLEKMFDNISWKYTLFYSNKTWFYEKNNIVWFDLKDTYLWSYKDNSSSHKWQDLDSLYSSSPKVDIYNIETNKRNQTWQGWDGTVPTKNLQLIVNDTYNKKEIDNNKFESIEMLCFDRELEENNTSRDLWSHLWELCSHTKMPIMATVDVIEEITWENLWNNKEEKTKKLYSYIWYIDYITKLDNSKKGISNIEKIDDIIETNYKKQFETRQDVDKFYTQRKFFWREKFDLWNKLASIIRYEIRSPINLIIEDEKWAKIWIDPESWKIINQIP